MFKTKYVFLVFILALLSMLTGCIDKGGPIYVDSILVYKNGVLLTGKYKYYDGSKWVDYHNEKITKEKIYYSVDVKDQDVKVVFNIYAPNTTLTELKLVTNSNLYYSNNNTIFINDDIYKEGSNFSCPYVFEFSNDFNAITVSGFATHNGLKYMGAKDDKSNFILYGVHLNFLDNS